jgi:hypothetical protein
MMHSWRFGGTALAIAVVLVLTLLLSYYHQAGASAAASVLRLLLLLLPLWMGVLPNGQWQRSGGGILEEPQGVCPGG